MGNGYNKNVVPQKKCTKRSFDYYLLCQGVKFTLRSSRLLRALITRTKELIKGLKDASYTLCVFKVVDYFELKKKAK